MYQEIEEVVQFEEKDELIFYPKSKESFLTRQALQSYLEKAKPKDTIKGYQDFFQYLWEERFGYQKFDYRILDMSVSILNASISYEVMVEQNQYMRFVLK